MYVCTIASRVDGGEGAPGVAFCRGKGDRTPSTSCVDVKKMH